MADGVEGLDEILGNLNRQIEGVKDRTVGGLLAAGLIIQGDAQKNVPVEYGNLRGSGYTRKAQHDPNAVEVGFTSAYAVYVHENLEQKWKGEERRSGLGTYWNPGGPKYLERAIRENRSRILEVIRSHAKVGSESE